MKSFLFGTVFGVSIGTVGVSGLAPIMDDGVKFIQTQTINAVQNSNRDNFTQQNQLPANYQQTGTTYGSATN